MRIVKDPEKAKDVLQEALMQVWRNAAKFDQTKGNAEAWMVGIVRFRAIDAIRRDRTKEDLVGGKADDFTDEPASHSAPEAYITLQNCLKHLGVRERQYIFEAHFAGYTHEELSIRHAAPLGTIKSRLRRSLFALKECLSQ